MLGERRAPLWWIFICGVIAISAMILPGLSGSFLLLFLGQYHAVFTALHQCIGHVLSALGRPMNPVAALTAHAWIDDFVFFGVFALGLLVGLTAFSRVVGWLFLRAHDLTMVALTGLMVGALRLPGEKVLAATDSGAGWTAPIIAAVIGAALVLALEAVDVRRRRAHG